MKPSSITHQILLVMVLVCLFISTGKSQAISSIITIPLYYTATQGGSYKWGIYASLGDSSTPALFEFDTGGGGFYATYSTTHSDSPWWGSPGSISTNAGGAGTADNQYDSGFSYSGNAVNTQVTLFTTNNSSSGLSLGAFNVGQTTNIINTKEGNESYWSNGPTPNNPPIDHAFFGDFGMDLGYSSNGLFNLIEQMQFTNGITPGFIVNTPLNGTNGFLQIGLSSNNTNQSGFNYFQMNANTNNTTASGTPFYSQSSVNLTMTISDGSSNYSTNVGIITDTGATPNIHNTQNATNPLFPTNWITSTVDGSGNTNQSLSNGLTFTLSETNTQGNLVTVYNIQTTNSDDYSNSNGIVAVQDSGTTHTNFNFNAGLYFFDNQQVSYNLSNGLIGLGLINSVPEPSTNVFFGLGFITLLAAYLRRRA